MKKYLLLVLILAAAVCHAQHQTFTDAQYAKKPLWIAMLNDSTANYHEVQNAFNIYFKHHQLPEEEEDVIGERRERAKHLSKRRRQELSRENKMRMAVKKYHWWCDRMLPYVQDDGSILTPSQRIEVWKKQNAQ